MALAPGGEVVCPDGSTGPVEPHPAELTQMPGTPCCLGYASGMLSRCARCGTPAATFMSYDYAERAVWLEDLSTATAESGHPLCVDHADRLTPPMGWTLTDRRSVTPLFAFDVA